MTLPPVVSDPHVCPADELGEEHVYESQDFGAQKGSWHLYVKVCRYCEGRKP